MATLPTTTKPVKFNFRYQTHSLRAAKSAMARLNKIDRDSLDQAGQRRHDNISQILSNQIVAMSTPRAREAMAKKK